MAGTLTISTLSDGTNSTSATNCIKGAGLAWINFSGITTTTIRGSYNVSSVTRNGTGDYTVNFTNAMPSANYGVSMSSGCTVGTGASYGFLAAEYLNASQTVSRTASAYRLFTNSGGGNLDSGSVNVLIMGN